MLKVYKYRLLPTEEQVVTLSRWIGTCRFIYNLALETKKTAWQSARKNLSAFDLINQLTELRKEYDWIEDCNRQSLEAAISNLDQAYKGFFRGKGFPRFKKKSGIQSITFRQRCRIEGDKIRLTKLGFIPFIKHRPIPPGKICTCVVTKTITNSWHVLILVEDCKEPPSKNPIFTASTVGIDVGLKTFAVLSEGTKFDNPKFLTADLKRLKKEQRTLARRYKRGIPVYQQSNRWHKQKLLVYKIYERISNKRQDFAHKVSDAITKQFDTICLEKLNIKGMIQNRSLSRAISDVGWYQFIKFLEYKAEWRGKNIIYISRFDPSSRLCSNCGNIYKELKLSDRQWDCPACLVRHDRDINAAINIKNLGLKTRPSFANVG